MLSLHNIVQQSTCLRGALIYLGVADGHTILLQGLSVKVITNLHAALRDIRSETSNKTLWVDAICINQDDILERNSQVMKMRDIYQKASRVAIWLGSESTNSPKALKFVAEFGYRLDHTNSTADVEKLIQNTFKLPRYEKSWAALSNVVTRPWWTRSWTFQKIMVASNAVVYCGSQSVFRKFFYQTAMLVDRYEKLFVRDEPVYHNASTFAGTYDHL